MDWNLSISRAVRAGFIRRPRPAPLPWPAVALIVIVQLGLAGPVLAQKAPPGLRVHRSPVTRHATFVTAADRGAIPVQQGNKAAPGPPGAMDFIVQYGHLFGVTDPANNLAAAETKVDALGRTRDVYRQVHKGIPVFSGLLKVHRNARGQFVAANGNIYTIPAKLRTQPTLTAAAAEALALAALPRDVAAAANSELVIVDPGWYGDAPTGARLAYHIILSNSAAALREAFFIDAHSGVILDRWNMIHHARNRKVHDGNGGSALPGTLIRSEGDPPVSLTDANRVYDYAGDVYDYFLRAFGRDSIDNAGMALSLTVNSTAPSPCPNAFWDGTQMVFCTGTVTDDIMAHELTHGITERTANLIYQNQSGQLNESFSDVFGELVDLFNGDAAFAGTPGGSPNWPAHPTGPGVDSPNNLRTGSCSPASAYADGVRWLIGEDATAFGGAIRDMWNPPCSGDPDRANSPLQTCSPFDNGGVHSGSGIPNHAFAIVTDGKTFNGQTVVGIGPIKSGAVWYRALTVYLAVASDFQDAYLALNQAALDLVGTYPNDPRTGLPSTSQFTAFDAEQVDKALLAVEMNTDGACGASTDLLNSSPPEQCSGRMTVYEDDFSHGANGWTVSNSGPPTPYNWVQISGSLPFGHPGTAWFCDDPNLGDCQFNDESGTHSLVSPVIAIPAGINRPTLSFKHYLATEAGYDGGIVRVRVNGGAWQQIPAGAFLYNPYNTTFQPAPGNTNPLAGLPGWSGAGGGWGTSLVDLLGIVAGGDSIEVEFRFGKDGCTGVDGWYIAHVEIYGCPCSINADCEDGNPCTDNVCDEGFCSFMPGQDCDGNGIPDSCDTDCNGNGIPDICDLTCAGDCGICYAGTCGRSADCQHDEIPDECQLAASSGVTVALHDNGPLITHAGAGFGGAHACAAPTSIGSVNLGYSHQVSQNARVADDFTVPAGGWLIENIWFYSYQTGSTTSSTTTAVNLRIWNGPPGVGTVVWGDTTTNRLSSTAFSGIYRTTSTNLTSNTRPIMKNVVQVGVHLNPGTYWLDWQTDGSLTSGPWAPPVTRPGQPGTGNGLEFENGTWAAAEDGIFFTWQDDFPFVIHGQAISPNGNDQNNNGVPDECDIPPTVVAAVSRKTHGSSGDFDIPLGVAPATGSVECRNNGPTQLVITFDRNILPADGNWTEGPGGEIQITSTPAGAIVVSGISVVGGNTLRIALSGVPDCCCLHVTLHGIASNLGGYPGPIMPDTALLQRVILGDTSNNGRVSSADINQIRSHVGQTLTSNNFRSDVGANGSISTADVNQVKSVTNGHAVSCP